MDRTDDLQAQIDDLALRLSAHEWVLEQLAARIALAMGPHDAKGFLGGLESGGGETFRIEDGHEAAVPPEAAKALNAVIKHLVGKVRRRVAQGIYRS